MLLNVPVAVQTVYMNFLKGNAKSGFGFWKIGFPKKFLKVFIFLHRYQTRLFFCTKLPDIPAVEMQPL